MLKRVFSVCALAALSFSIAPLSEAQPLPCGSFNYMITEDGNCINLDNLGSYSVRTTNKTPRENSQSHPFPNWLIGGSEYGDERKRRQTNFESTDENTDWAYDNRFILTFREWPFTASADNEAEWSYLDCHTAWKYYKSNGLADSGSEFSTPPDDDIYDNFPNHLDTKRSQCDRMGISPKF